MARKLPLVHCRVCKKEIDRQNETGWIMPVNKFYYHEKCYADWVEKKDDLHAKASDNEWYEAMIYYLSHVIKAEIDYKKTTSQWKSFLKQNKTAKGVYFAIRYFYDVQHGDKTKCQGGIGIVESTGIKEKKMIEVFVAALKSKLSNNLNSRKLFLSKQSERVLETELFLWRILIKWRIKWL